MFSPRGDRAGARVQVSNEPGYGQPSVIVGEYVVMVSAAGARQSEQHRLVSAPIFSPDGGRFVYLAAATDREVYVVTDAGREGPYADVSYPSFSARGHLAFTVRKPGEDPEWLVVDGRWGPAREQVEHPQFSPDGARVVYATTRGRDWHVVVDDELGPAFEQVGVVRFSADGARISYGARRRGRPVVVVDGAVRELPAGAEAVVLGPSFDRILHQTAAGGVRTLHLDGRAVASWDDVSSGGAPVFAADGASFAYVEWRGGMCAAVVADARGRRLREGRRFQTIQQLYFAPRGDALAYAGCEADGCRVMWGDREGPRFTGTSEPVFSPDGRTIAYLAGGPQGTLVMVGEQSYGPYPLVAPPVFSSDGR